ncbi:MAG: hypothetical protein BGN87_22575 [Rhizobiales bacterium 65-79]|jgi:hypothetical protein|nr:hypothetical protein [Hyphomicrobiales bacterium]OJU00110.1 MAG: hypothetical protein BGN87_22575 [Rhizobiales bacterium 65-79]
MSEYSKLNQDGRQHAARLIEDCRLTGDLPRFVRKIREMAADDSGVGVGFLHEVGELAIKGSQKSSFAELGEKLA